MDKIKMAPGAPGSVPVWTSSSKSGFGKALNSASQVTFTISNGILSEVYYPREDIACIKDMQFAVTDGTSFFADEKGCTDHTVKMLEDGIPAFGLDNACRQKTFTIEKEIITDPFRSTLLQKVRFKAAEEAAGKYRLYILLSPHLHNTGKDNTGWTGNYKGVPMLFAENKGLTLALACSVPWVKRSVGFKGTSDGLTDLQQHKTLQWEYEKAEGGNIMLTGQIDLSANTDFTIAVGFGKNETEAGNAARSSLLEGFDTAKKYYIQEWEAWHQSFPGINIEGENFRTSAAVLRMADSKSFPGGMIASISIPWGHGKEEKEPGGYHLVWPRDLVQSSGGFLALGAMDDTLRVTNYLMATQEADGRWHQNMWLDGHPNWTAIQMDQVALPIIQIDRLQHLGMLDKDRMQRYWPIVRNALSFLVKNGPSTEQERWEMFSGLTTYTLASEIAALLAGAHLAELNNEKIIAEYCRELADYWNDNIEAWTYVTGTPLAKETGVEGYYILNNPDKAPANKLIEKGPVQKPGDKKGVPDYDIIAVDALALVRFGLRAPDDPHILNSIKVMDAKLKVDTPAGPCWKRFIGDVYGEDEEGNAFKDDEKNGTGRPWPLLNGERGHYEIAAGNIEGAKALFKTMEAFAEYGLLPEQIWDAPDIPEKDLYFGKHSGSAMPLTWAHAEYVKLCRSILDGKVFDMPEHTQQRYLKEKAVSLLLVWRLDWPQESITAGKKLRVEVLQPALIRWTDDNWNTEKEVETTDTTLGIFYADISFRKGAEAIVFTIKEKEKEHSENKEYTVKVQPV